jgi:DNA-directed RNA polymerase specialized sigma24 family protein
LKIEQDLVTMMIDQQLRNSIFAGNNVAFTLFYEKTREKFMAYFSKKYPDKKDSFPDLFQDSTMELWSQIIDRKITEQSLKCSLETYVISIGINKMHEDFRRIVKKNKIAETLKYRPDSYHNNKPMFLDNSGDEARNERLCEWSDFLKNKYEDLPFPCNQLLRDTWYNEMTDKEILEAFNGYFDNTNVIKTKRYKCHKTLLNMFNAWKNAKN